MDKQIWIGEAAFMRALLKNDEIKYIPPFVNFVLDLIPIGKLVLITSGLVKEVRNFSGENNTKYATARPSTVGAYLSDRVGSNAYTATR